MPDDFDPVPPCNPATLADRLSAAAEFADGYHLPSVAATCRAALAELSRLRAGRRDRAELIRLRLACLRRQERARELYVPREVDGRRLSVAVADLDPEAWAGFAAEWIGVED